MTIKFNASAEKQNNFLSDILSCPKCFNLLNINNSHKYICSKCNSDFKVRENIPILTDKEAYWCNFPKEMMQKLNETAEKEGYDSALRKIIKDEEIRNHMTDETRVDPLFFLPVTSESVVLDVGCKWGGLTIPFSDYCKQIVGIDTTYETIKFLEVRKRQLKNENISLAVASALSLPFKENSFDVVLLNGVLEWIGYEDDFDATVDYGKKRKKLNINKSKPDELQKIALKNILRVLKPNGVLFIGIENRFALDYFLGVAEEHTNLKYTSIMPRKLTNWYMKKKLNQEFRVYTYSMPALNKILKNVGFKKIEFLTAFKTYREPDYIFSLENPRLLKYFLKHYMNNQSRNPLKRFIKNFLINSGLYKYFVHSFLVLAQK